MKYEAEKAGFTLIELLVVIAILGALSITALTMFQGSQRRTRDTRRKNDLSQIAKALEMYNTDYGGYPASTGGTINGCGTVASAASCSWGGVWSRGTATYMQKLPNDPTGGSYCYTLDPIKGRWYKLFAKLEDTSDSEYNASGLLTCNGDNTYTYVLLSPNITPTPKP